MNNEFFKKTLVFISCLIFLEDKENIGSGFKITENGNESYFKLLSRNKEQSFESVEGDFLDFKWDNNDFKLGFYFKEDLKICIFDEEKIECWEIVYEKELNLSNFDSFFNINVSFFDQDMSNNNEKIVIKNDLNKIIGRSSCGIEWDIENEDLDEFEDAENSEGTEDGYSSSASEIGDDSIDLSEMVNALDNSFVQLKTTSRASFKESLRGVKSRIEPIYECPVFEDASDYKNKHELFVDLKDNLEKSQSYFFRTLNKEHVLDFTDEIPMNNDLLEDYTLITLYSSQYITNGYKTVKKENDEVVIQEMQKKLGQEEPKKPTKTNDKKVKTKFMDVNKTKIKETQRYVFVRKTNGDSEKTSLRKKTGKCLNNVQVYLSYFSKKQSFKYKPKYKRPFPSKVLDFSVCGYDKYYFSYNSPVITFVKENYNVLGDYSRITVKRKSFILNPRVYLMVRLLFIDKVFIDKKQWDFLLLAVHLIFDEIKKIKFVLKGKSGYLKRLKRTILRIETVFNYEKSDKIFYVFFDSLFCKKIIGTGKSFFIKEKMNGRVLKNLCKELDKMNVLPPCFIDRVFKALEIVTEKRA